MGDQGYRSQKLTLEATTTKVETKERKEKSMDEELERAVLSEDVSFLKQKIDECNSNNDYSYITKHEENKGNILHLAANNDNILFFEEAIKQIPVEMVQQLLCHREQNYENQVFNFNPLHVAAWKGHIEIVKLIIRFYNDKTEKSNLGREEKPWLAKDRNGRTPLHVALENMKEECALVILSIDEKPLCNSVDSNKNSPVFLAVKNGYNKVALQIVRSEHSYSVSGNGGYTALHFMPNCSDEVCRLLVQNNKNQIKDSSYDESQTILHKWVELGEMDIFEHLVTREEINDEIKSHLVDLITKGDRTSNNPFHILVRKGNKRASKMLTKFYKKKIAGMGTVTGTGTETGTGMETGMGRVTGTGTEMGTEMRTMMRTGTGLGTGTGMGTGTGTESEALLPWLACNTSFETPLELALKSDSKILKWLQSTYKNKERYRKDEPLYLALKDQNTDIVDELLDAYIEYGWSPLYHDVPKIWEAALEYTEHVALKVAKQLSRVISEDEAVKALVEASEKGYHWLVTPMLRKYPQSLRKDPLAWKKACENGHFSTIMAFIKSCSYFREVCLQERVTPLHFIKFKGFEQYLEFLELPMMKGLKNYPDKDGATPLHQAIKSGNIELTEVLLNMDDVSRSLKDIKEHKTPMALLDDACNKDPDKKWLDLCRRNGLVPGLIKFFVEKRNMYEVRNTLSLVAALLATITFTAGFTIPGGFNNDTGEAILADKAAFTVFIISDGLAMCFSLLMLAGLVWSMVCDNTTSLILIDNCMPILLMALVSTLLAFMTGVYTILRQKSLGAAIVIIAMCSIFILLANKPMMNMFLCIFDHDRYNKYRSLEQGMGHTSQEGRSSWKVFKCFRSGRGSSHQRTD